MLRCVGQMTEAREPWEMQAVSSAVAALDVHHAADIQQRRSLVFGSVGTCMPILVAIAANSPTKHTVRQQPALRRVASSMLQALGVSRSEAFRSSMGDSRLLGNMLIYARRGLRKNSMHPVLQPLLPHFEFRSSRSSAHDLGATHEQSSLYSHTSRTHA